MRVRFDEQPAPMNARLDHQAEMMNVRFDALEHRVAALENDMKLAKTHLIPPTA